MKAPEGTVAALVIVAVIVVLIALAASQPPPLTEARKEEIRLETLKCREFVKQAVNAGIVRPENGERAWEDCMKM